MQINLKKTELTIKGLQELITSKDDSEHRQIRVTKDGILFISDDVGADNLDNILFRLETLTRTAGYVGPAAAQDDKYIQQVYNMIKANWPKPKCDYIEIE